MNIIHYIAKLFKRKPVKKYPGFPIRVRLKSGGVSCFTQHIPEGTILHVREHSEDFYRVSSDSIADSMVGVDASAESMFREGGAVHVGLWTLRKSEVEVVS